MIDLDRVAEACAVLVDPDAPAGFCHHATAWSVGPGEWVSVWPHEEAPAPSLRLLPVVGGGEFPVHSWEHDGGLAGFRSTSARGNLPVARGAALHKRMPLCAVGWPSIIDHPSFSLHRGSLDAERYLPYLCPWRLDGHLALFTATMGYLAGRAWAGMEGGPVFVPDGDVIGVLAPSVHHQAGEPPLAAFLRLD